MNTITFASLICLHSLWPGWALEVIPERCVMEYVNKTYIAYFKVDIRKRSRRSPYYGYIEGETYWEVGNNVTVSVVVMEYLSNGYQPTLLQIKRGLCDWYYNEPIIGQFISKQLPQNISCPVKKGKYNVTGLNIHIANLPFNSMPFTWQDIRLKARVDFEAYKTGTNIILTKFQVFVTFKTKPEKDLKIH